MKILLATDGSEYSEESARFLTRFSLSPKDEIIVLHVISSIPFPDDYQAQIKRAIKRVAPKILSSAAGILKPLNTKIVTLEEEGDPFATIIDTAERFECGLIVMGARGVRGMKLLFVGSTTRQVALNATRPVLVTRSPLTGKPGRMKVLFVTDGSDSAKATGKALASLPLPGGSEVTVMHVVRSISPEIPEKYMSEMDADLREEFARAETREATSSEKIIDEARGLLGSSLKNIRGLTKAGDPASEILREAQAMDADIIALGSRGLKGIKGMLGSVSRRVLSNAGCAVLIGK